MQKAVSVGNGGEAWIGYKQDLRPCQFGLMMSIEPSFSVFYEGLSIVDYTQAVLTKNPMRPWEWTNDFLTPPEQKEISKELKGLVVRTRVPASKRPIHCANGRMCPSARFSKCFGAGGRGGVCVCVSVCEHWIQECQECMQVAGKYGKSNRETSFTAKGLSKEGANKYMFGFMDKATGQEKQMSVAAYFHNILGIQLEFPALQCVTVRAFTPY